MESLRRKVRHACRALSSPLVVLHPWLEMRLHRALRISYCNRKVAKQTVWFYFYSFSLLSLFFSFSSSFLLYSLLPFLHPPFLPSFSKTHFWSTHSGPDRVHSLALRSLQSWHLPGEHLEAHASVEMWGHFSSCSLLGGPFPEAWCPSKAWTMPCLQFEDLTGFMWHLSYRVFVHCFLKTWGKHRLGKTSQSLRTFSNTHLLVPPDLV